MKAFTIWNYAPGQLFREEVPAPPPPAPGQVQLKLLATSINPVDRLIAGGYGAPLFNPKLAFPVVLGRDAVAEVVAVGNGIRDVQKGQRMLVASSPRTGGTYAELFNLPHRCIAPINERLSITTAAGLGYAGLTAMQALAAAGISADTARGKRLCINGASGGVGSIALLLASQWGAEVSAVASQRNHDWLRSFAFCRVVDYRDPVALASIQADIILNCATPASGEQPNIDPLLEVLQSSHAHSRAYATTVTPVLTYVTQQGLLAGMARSGTDFLNKSLRMRRRGIRYRWVMFKENPKQLAALAEFFALPGIPNLVGARKELDSLPAHFNEPPLTQPPGKMVFVASNV